MFALLIALLGAEPPAPAPTVQDPQVISHPYWVRMPNANSYASHFPPKALARGISGHVLMECKATAEGKLVDYRIVEETPKGQGFGDATLGIARYYRMREMTPDGKPVDGAKIVIPVNWSVR